MIVGSDKRYLSKDVFDRTDPPHTDTILLVRLDPRAGAVTVLSVPRDLLVPSFSFHGQTYVNQKINYAYTVGSLYGKSSTAGDELALAVVKHALDGIQINDFIDLNFVTFTKVVSEARLRLHQRRPPLPDPAQHAASRRSTSTPAISRSATTARSPTCATATPTARSRATPASRTSCARPRPARGLRPARTTRQVLTARQLGRHERQAPQPARASRGSSTSRPTRWAGRSARSPSPTTRSRSDPGGVQADQTATPRQLRHVIANSSTPRRRRRT